MMENKEIYIIFTHPCPIKLSEYHGISWDKISSIRKYLHKNKGPDNNFNTITSKLHILDQVLLEGTASTEPKSSHTMYIRLARIHWTSSMSTSSTCMNFKATRKASRDN